MTLSSAYQLSGIISILDERVRQDQEWGNYPGYYSREWAVILGKVPATKLRAEKRLSRFVVTYSMIIQCADVVDDAWIKFLASQGVPDVHWFAAGTPDNSGAKLWSTLDAAYQMDA